MAQNNRKSPRDNALEPATAVREGPVSPAADSTQLLRKAVNTLAIVPKSTKITTLGRKAYNVLLYRAQDQGLDKEVFSAPLDDIVKGVDFDSNDHALIKKHLRAMVSTTVEWQSPTTGEGAAWHVSGLLAHASLTKRSGQVWVEWSYAVNLKQELLEPTVFARLRLEVISQLRRHASVALYEICTRYKDIGRTARQAWRWWWPVLTGQPVSAKLDKLEYRIFKRDTLTPAVSEINAITDIEVELVEHKLGRSIDQIQFVIRQKRQGSLLLNQAPAPVDLAIIGRATGLGVVQDTAETLLQEYGEDALRAGLDALERRLATNFPEPLRDPGRYLRALMPGEGEKSSKRAEEQAARAAEQADPQSPANRELQDKRRQRWAAEWLRRRREKCASDIEMLSPERQRELEDGLLQQMREANAHPSLVKRLQTSGWQHPLVRHEMLKYFGVASYGENWDQPSAEQLLAIAAELGEAG